jgi:hypothetical protein
VDERSGNFNNEKDAGLDGIKSSEGESGTRWECKPLCYAVPVAARGIPECRVRRNVLYALAIDIDLPVVPEAFEIFFSRERACLSGEAILWLAAHSALPLPGLRQCAFPRLTFLYRADTPGRYACGNMRNLSPKPVRAIPKSGFVAARPSR